jgi:4-amino-4-deoxy-L-arabinose transferase-like glycosyltransferase
MNQPVARRTGRWTGVGLALGTGLLLRVLWVIVCPNEPFSDQSIYEQGAIAIARGSGFVGPTGEPIGSWPVGYPAILSLAYRVSGTDPVVAFGVNTVLSWATLVATAVLAWQWFDQRSAVLALWLVALNPTLILYTTCIASENAFIPGVVFVLAAATRSARTAGLQGALWAGATGALIGIVSYVRATIVIVALVVPVIYALHGLSRRVGLQRTAIAAVIAGLVILPGAFRNQEAFGKFQPFSLNGGSNLWMGNHEGTDGGYAPMPDRMTALPLAEMERQAKAEAMEFISADPLRYLALSLRRAVATMKSDTIAVVWNKIGIERRFGKRAELPLKLLTTGAHLALWGLALAGLAVEIRRRWAVRRWRLSAPVTMTVSALLLLAVPFVFIVSGNRYHLPLIPLAALLAASFVAGVVRARGA